MNVLALGPHPDDIAIGCGATLFKMASRGDIVTCYVFTDCRDELPEGWAADSLVLEEKAAMGFLEVQHLYFFSNVFKNKSLERKRQGVLDILYALKGWPDVVFCPSSYNSNQDHLTVHNEAKRAFRSSTVLGYATPSSDYGFTPSPVYMPLSEVDVDVKRDAIACYLSQFELKRPYFDRDWMRAMARVCGLECSWPLAERFENVRFVMR